MGARVAKKRIAKRSVRSPWLVWALTTGIFGLAAWLIVHQWHSVSQSIEAMRHVSIGWIALAVISIALSVVGGALAYRMIALRGVTFGSVLLVSWAGMFVNRLLPAGVGGIGLFVDYLIRRGHKPAEASGVVLVSSLLTFVGHALCVIALVVLVGTPFSLRMTMPPLHAALAGAAIVSAVGVSMYIARGRLQRMARNWCRQLRSPFLRLCRQPGRWSIALVGALLNTGGHAFALFVAMHAVGLDLSFAAAFIVLAGGVLAATVSPTPGGLVGAEAGLIAAMVLYGADPILALSAALLYRLASYWIPLVIGVIALTIARRQKLV